MPCRAGVPRFPRRVRARTGRGPKAKGRSLSNGSNGQCLGRPIQEPAGTVRTPQRPTNVPTNPQEFPHPPNPPGSSGMV
eukprot:2492872-Pyramimonas_sp.AAC.1